MKIVFAGTPEFASKHLEMILKSEHEIVFHDIFRHVVLNFGTAFLSDN